MTRPICAQEDCEHYATDAIHGVIIEGERFTVYVCDSHTGEAIRAN